MYTPTGILSSQKSNAENGMIRFNTKTNLFEGYSNNIWSSLGGGVRDLDRDTFIAASSENSTDSDSLHFITDGVERMVIDSIGNTSITNNNITLKGFTTLGPFVKIDGNLEAIGNTKINGTLQTIGNSDFKGDINIDIGNIVINDLLQNFKNTVPLLNINMSVK